MTGQSTVELAHELFIALGIFTAFAAVFFAGLVAWEWGKRKRFW